MGSDTYIPDKNIPAEARKAGITYDDLRRAIRKQVKSAVSDFDRRFKDEGETPPSFGMSDADKAEHMTFGYEVAFWKHLNDQGQNMWQDLLQKQPRLKADMKKWYDLKRIGSLVKWPTHPARIL